MKKAHHFAWHLLTPFSGFFVFLVTIFCLFLTWNSIVVQKEDVLEDYQQSSEPFFQSFGAMMFSFNLSFLSDSAPELSEEVWEEDIKHGTYFVITRIETSPTPMAPEQGWQRLNYLVEPDASIYTRGRGGFVLEGRYPASKDRVTEMYIRWRISINKSAMPRDIKLFLVAGDNSLPLMADNMDSTLGTMVAKSRLLSGTINWSGKEYIFSTEGIDGRFKVIALFESTFWNWIPSIQLLTILVLYLLFLSLSLRLRTIRNAIMEEESGHITGLLSSHQLLTPKETGQSADRMDELGLIEMHARNIQRQIRYAFDAIGAGVFFLRKDEILYINNRAIDIFAIQGEDLSEITLSAITKRMLDPDTGNAVSLKELIDKEYSGEPVWVKVELPKEERWLQLIVSPLSLGGEAFYIVTFFDQTQVKEYEEHVSRQSNFMNSILESISDPFYVIDAETRGVVMSNSAAKELMQRKNATNCQALNPDSHVCANKSQLCPFELSKLTKVSSIVERIHVTDRGQKQYFEIHAHPVIGEDDEVSHVIEYQLNVTERKNADQSLRESEERYSSLFEKNNSVMLLYEPESGQIVDANPAACEFYGYSREEFISKHIVDINTMSPFELYREMQLAKRENRHQLYFEHRLANGEIRDVEAYSGLIKVAGKNLYYSIIYDISERRQAERELKNLIDLETLAASLSTRFIRVQAQQIDDQIEEALAEIGQFAGFERCTLFTVDASYSGVNICHEWHDPLVNPAESALKSMGFSNLSWLESHKDDEPSISVYDVRRSGSMKIREMQFWQDLGIQVCHYITFTLTEGDVGVILFETSSTPSAWNENNDAFLRIIAELLNNALEKKYYEQKMLENQQVLKQLSSHIQDEIESVRSSIAREIHDELGQLLTALKFDVRYISKNLEEPAPSTTEKLVSMEEVIDYAINSVQRITAELRPILLDDLGLGPAIEWHAQEFSRRTSIEVKLDLDDVEVDSQQTTTLFRICQEALTNVARHSKADSATIELTREYGGVRMRITDNGVGITKEQIQSNKSFGIIGLRERVNTIGGVVTIQGKRNQGTVIDVWIPLENTQEETQ